MAKKMNRDLIGMGMKMSKKVKYKSPKMKAMGMVHGVRPIKPAKIKSLV